MFHYEMHKNMSLSKSGECTRLVLRDKNGSVIFLAMELDEDHFILGKKGDVGFENLLKSFNLASVNDADNSNDV